MRGHGHPGADQHCAPVLHQGNPAVESERCCRKVEFRKKILREMWLCGGFAVGDLPQAARRDREDCDYSHTRQRESSQGPGITTLSRACVSETYIHTYTRAWMRCNSTRKYKYIRNLLYHQHALCCCMLIWKIKWSHPQRSNGWGWWLIFFYFFFFLHYQHSQHCQRSPGSTFTEKPKSRAAVSLRVFVFSGWESPWHR